MGSSAAQQLVLFDGPETTDTTGTFVDNLSLPIHRWFRYTAGFSALWVRELITQQKANSTRRVLDPFAGSATVLLESEFCDTESMGVEAHPFIVRVARAKLHWREDPKAFGSQAAAILDTARCLGGSPEGYASLINRCYPPEVLSQLDALRRAWSDVADGSPASELAWLALVSILRQCSPVGTAQWQYVLPNKSKSKSLDPYQAFEAKVRAMAHDMVRRQAFTHGPAAGLHWDDARQCSSVPDGWADLVVTSPPYANNYDYADATRLEMSFLGEVATWGDLQDAARKYLLRSCTQHVASLVAKTYELVEAPLLAPIREELRDTCSRLEVERTRHRGKKAYHTMIAAYFTDMARTWETLRRVTSDNALVCFVIGDSAPYGIYVPVDRWLGELAVANGFQSCEFEKLRDRNVKWKNRKHRVPLKEGRLWVRR
jgi:hypothetical protein